MLADTREPQQVYLEEPRKIHERKYDDIILTQWQAEKLETLGFNKDEFNIDKNAPAKSWKLFELS